MAHPPRGSARGGSSVGGNGMAGGLSGRGSSRGARGGATTRGGSRGGVRGGSAAAAGSPVGVLQALRSQRQVKQPAAAAATEASTTATAAASTTAALAKTPSTAMRGGLLRQRGKSQVQRSDASKKHDGTRKEYSQQSAAKLEDRGKEGFELLKEQRKSERAQGIADGLLHDPSKKRTLETAITPVGTCEDMCPAFERAERVQRHEVDRCEKIQPLDGGPAVPSAERMVKKFVRSDAGREEQLPSDIRTPEALVRTMDHLIEDVVGKEDRLIACHNFVWDRTRAVRNDFSIQQVSAEAAVRMAVDCHERSARFLIVSLHILSDEAQLRPGDHFDAQQDVEQLNKTFTSLWHYYDAHRGAIHFPNEAEFRSYQILFEILSATPDLEDRMHLWPYDVLADARVQTALQLYQVANDTLRYRGPLRPFTPDMVAQMNACAFWDLLASPSCSYLMACVAEMSFHLVRFGFLTVLWRSVKSAPKAQQERMKEWTVSEMRDFLSFDADAQVENFCAALGLEFHGTNDKGEHYLEFARGHAAALVLELDNVPTKQVFSYSLVEAKRLHRSYVALINGMTAVQAIEAYEVVEEGDGRAQHQHQQQTQSEQPDDDDEHSMFFPETSTTATTATTAGAGAGRTFGSLQPPEPKPISAPAKAPEPAFGSGMFSSGLSATTVKPFGAGAAQVKHSSIQNSQNTGILFSSPFGNNTSTNTNTSINTNVNTSHQQPFPSTSPFAANFKHGSAFTTTTTNPSSTPKPQPQTIDSSFAPPLPPLFGTNNFNLKPSDATPAASSTPKPQIVQSSAGAASSSSSSAPQSTTANTSVPFGGFSFTNNSSLAASPAPNQLTAAAAAAAAAAPPALFGGFNFKQSSAGVASSSAAESPAINPPALFGGFNFTNNTNNNNNNNTGSLTASATPNPPSVAPAIPSGGFNFKQSGSLAASSSVQESPVVNNSASLANFNFPSGSSPAPKPPTAEPSAPSNSSKPFVFGGSGGSSSQLSPTTSFFGSGSAVAAANTAPVASAISSTLNNNPLLKGTQSSSTGFAVNNSAASSSQSALQTPTFDFKPASTALSAPAPTTSLSVNKAIPMSSTTPPSSPPRSAAAAATAAAPEQQKDAVAPPVKDLASQMEDFVRSIDAAIPHTKDLVPLAARLAFTQPNGLLHEYLEYTLEKLLPSIVEQHQAEVFAQAVARLKEKTLARKWFPIWRRLAYESRLNRRAVERRKRFAESVRLEADKKRKREKEVEEIIAAMEESKRIRAEQEQAKKAAEKAKVEQEAEAARLRQERAQAIEKARKGKRLVVSDNLLPPVDPFEDDPLRNHKLSRSNRGPTLPPRYHKRARSTGASLHPPPRPSQPPPAPSFMASLFSTGNSSIMKLRRSMSLRESQRPRPAAKPQHMDNTRTDFFRLLAHNIDPETPLIPLTQAQVDAKAKREKEIRAARISAMFNRHKLGYTAPPPRQPSPPPPPPPEKAPVAPPSPPIRKSTYDPDSDPLIQQMRETRKMLAEGSEWFKEQISALSKEDAEQEARSLRSTNSTSQNSLRVSINGVDYVPAAAPCRSISRTEQLIRSFGLDKTLDKPKPKYGIDSLPPKASQHPDARSNDDLVDEAAQHSSNSRKRKAAFPLPDPRFDEEEEEELYEDSEDLVEDEDDEGEDAQNHYYYHNDNNRGQTAKGGAVGPQEDDLVEDDDEEEDGEEDQQGYTHQTQQGQQQRHYHHHNYEDDDDDDLYEEEEEEEIESSTPATQTSGSTGPGATKEDAIDLGDSD